MRCATIVPLAVAAIGMVSVLPGDEQFASHPPMRPLPEARSRPISGDAAYFVDAKDGNDGYDGSRNRPWRTINHALEQATPGQTICLRGGTYYERVIVPVSGTEEKPITLRSFPGELAVIDGGLREFYESPETAWMHFPDGSEDEYVSTKVYPQFGARPIFSAFLADGWEPFHGIEEQRPVVLGHFGDSMVPLHGYRTLADLRDDSMLWDVSDKFDGDEGVYCGPGLWFNRETNHIHIRLAHTTLDGLGDDAYRGQTDPRKLPLVISGPCGADVLRINGIRNFVLQDVVLRGASGSPAVNIRGASNITLDGVTIYGGSPGLLVKATDRLRIVNCAFRGLAAPWSSRASMKYRGTPSYVIITQRNKPQNRDFEFANNEFTDGHDFAWIRYVKNLKFHHNFVDNFNDDGLEVGAKKRDHELYISQNFVSRCLITFALHEMDPDESPAEVDAGSGVYITRNIIDLRHGVPGAPPREPDSGGLVKRPGTLCGDHGSPIWPHYYFYHNTVVRADTAWRGYYGFGIGGRGVRDTKRRVLNNIFVQLKGVPGLNFSPNFGDFIVDGNLHWGQADGPAFEGDFFAKQGHKYALRGKPYPRGWMDRDQFADPRFVKIGGESDARLDLRIHADSPAVDAGTAVPGQWFDPLRSADQGEPDIGAIPKGTQTWRVGIDGRLNMFGDP